MNLKPAGASTVFAGTAVGGATAPEEGAGWLLPPAAPSLELPPEAPEDPEDPEDPEGEAPFGVLAPHAVKMSSVVATAVKEAALRAEVRIQHERTRRDVEPWKRVRAMAGDSIARRLGVQGAHERLRVSQIVSVMRLAARASVTVASKTAASRLRAARHPLADSPNREIPVVCKANRAACSRRVE